jgi:hypothetical protein
LTVINLRDNVSFAAKPLHKLPEGLSILLDDAGHGVAGCHITLASQRHPKET